MKRALAFTLMVLAIMIIAVSCEEPQAQVHEHTYAEEWSHDDTFHWHASACGHEEEVSDKEAHKWKEGGDEDGWIIDEDSTEKEVGKKHRECSVCGYKEEGKVPLKGHVHTFSAYDHTADKHWRTCTGCGEKFTYTHTFSYVDAGTSGHYEKCYCEYSKSTVDHVYTDKKVLKNDNKIYKICDLCDNSDTEAPTGKTSGVVAASETRNLSEMDSVGGTVTVKENGKDVTKEVKVIKEEVKFEVAATAETETKTTNVTTVTFPSGALKADKDATSVSLIVETADITAASANNSGYQITTSGSGADTGAVVAGFEFNLSNAVASDLSVKDSSGKITGVTVKTYIAPGLTTDNINSYNENNTLKIVYVGNDEGETPKITKYVTETGELEYTVYHFSRYAIVSTNIIATDNLGQMYSGLSAAVNALGTEKNNTNIKKITLLKNVEVTSEISFSRTGTIDLNGKIITAEDTDFTVITNNGTLTLENGTLDLSAASGNGYTFVANKGTLSTDRVEINMKYTANGTNTDSSVYGIFSGNGSGKSTLNLLNKTKISLEVISGSSPIKPTAVYCIQNTESKIEESTITTESSVDGSIYGFYVLVYDQKDATGATDATGTLTNTTINVSTSGVGSVTPVFAESKDKTGKAVITAIEDCNVISKGTNDSSKTVYGIRAKGNAVITVNDSTITNTKITKGTCKEMKLAAEKMDHDNTANGVSGTISSSTYVAVGADGTLYESLANAVSGEASEGTITLLNNINLNNTDDFKIDGGKKFTIDMNGKTLTVKKRIWIQDANVTLTGTGTLKTEATNTNTYSDNSVFWLYGSVDDPNAKDYTVLTAGEGITIEGKQGICVNTLNDRWGIGCYGVVVNLDGTTINSWLCGLYINGNCTKTDGNVPVFNLNNVKITQKGTSENTSDDCVGIYGAGYAKWNINGNSTTVSGVDSAIEIRAGELKIDNGSFTASAEQSSVDPNGAGTTTKGAALAVAQHTTSLPITVTISNGRFVGYHALSVSDPQDKKESEGTNWKEIKVTVTGGYFGSSKSQEKVYVENGKFKLSDNPAYGTDTNRNAKFTVSQIRE